jgi:hypothetical protein
MTDKPMSREEFNARIAEIEQGIALYKQIRALEIAGMQSSVVVEMARAVPDSLIRQIVSDNRRAAQLAPAAAPVPERGTGWVDQAPLRSPPGVELIDRMMAVDDRRWRAEREREFGVEPPPKPPAAPKPFQRRV